MFNKKSRNQAVRSWSRRSGFGTRRKSRTDLTRGSHKFLTATLPPKTIVVQLELENSNEEQVLQAGLIKFNKGRVAAAPPPGGCPVIRRSAGQFVAAIRFAHKADSAKSCDGFVRGWPMFVRLFHFHGHSLAWGGGQWLSKAKNIFCGCLMLGSGLVEALFAAVPMFIAFPMGKSLQGNH